MEEVVWSVEERFTFPAVGLVREAEVDVTPQWQWNIAHYLFV